jgi:hypothetical protein
MAITIIPCREEEMRVVSPPGSFLSDSLFWFICIHVWSYNICIYFFRRPYDLWKAAYASVFPPEVSDLFMEDFPILHKNEGIFGRKFEIVIMQSTWLLGLALIELNIGRWLYNW